jgi:2,4-dienoyl-CoA reductase-like NADH-dependent reductase (Old Yellow Enzyme family)
MAALFDPFKLRGVELRNRIGVSPMGQASSRDGFTSDWHLVHLGARAAGGAALVMTEATAVEARGRSSINDLGIWKDEHVEGLERVRRFIHAEGAVAGIQLAHGGRKSSYAAPFDENGIRPLQQLGDTAGAWQTLAASPIAFDEHSPLPVEMTLDDIETVLNAYEQAAIRAAAAGFDWIEVHAAHGYLPHCFYSPVSNQRSDEYGGSFENRIRFALEIARRVRRVWPDDKVLAFRLSYTDWIDGGWTTEETVGLARGLKQNGVDLVDVSSGGSAARTVTLAEQSDKDEADHGQDGAKSVARIPIGPGYQVAGARAVKKGAGIPVAAVGLITELTQAHEIIVRGQADLVLLGREILRNPNWPQHAAVALGDSRRVRIPVQYDLAWRERGQFSYQPVSGPVQRAGRP